jgi:hypothetical protein
LNRSVAVPVDGVFQNASLTLAIANVIGGALAVDAPSVMDVTIVVSPESTRPPVVLVSPPSISPFSYAEALPSPPVVTIAARDNITSVIRYTVAGRGSTCRVTLNSTVYAEPFLVPAGFVVVCAIAYAEDGRASGLVGGVLRTLSLLPHHRNRFALASQENNPIISLNGSLSLQPAELTYTSFSTSRSVLVLTDDVWSIDVSRLPLWIQSVSPASGNGTTFVMVDLTNESFSVTVMSELVVRTPARSVTLRIVKPFEVPSIVYTPTLIEQYVGTNHAASVTISVSGEVSLSPCRRACSIGCAAARDRC